MRRMKCAEISLPKLVDNKSHMTVFTHMENLNFPN